MNSVFSFLPDGGWQRFLCDALWQSTLVAGLGLLAARFLVRQSAARAWLLLLALIACAFVPLASLAARQHGWGLVARNERTSGILPLSPVNQDAGQQLAMALPSQTLDPPDAPNKRSIPPLSTTSQDIAPAAAQLTEEVASHIPDLTVAASSAPAESGSRPFDAFGLLAAAWLAGSAILALRLA